jgi:hypothetical protein
MWFRGLMLSSITFIASASAQQQQQPDTSKHGWGIVYSSPKSRANSASVAPSSSSTTPSTSGITAVPAPGTPAPPTVTTLPTIRGSHYSGDAPVAATPPANGVYMGDRPPASAPAVAAQGTYDTLPPAPASSGGGGVHLDELMSLHEYTSTGLTNLKPQEVQALEIWLQRYRAAVIDSTNRAAQQRMPTSQIAPVAPAPAPAATAAANTRALPPANAHTVTGIRSGSRFVQIDDGSVWDVYPADQTETANWQVGDFVTVRVASQAYGEFDHELVNSQRTGPVRAKFMGYARGQ